MHKPEDVNITYIPHDFKVSLTLFNLSIHRFLQCFIDHVSFYDALFPSTVDAYVLATRTLQKYSFEKEENKQKVGETSEKKGNLFVIESTETLEESVQAIKAMGQISIRKDLNNKQKRKAAKKRFKSSVIP